MAGRSIENIFAVVNDTKSKIYSIFLFPLFFSTGKKSTIIPPLRFAGLSDIAIGSFVTIHSNCWIQALTRGESNTGSPKIIIKDYVSIGMDATISAVKQIVLEEYVFTARNVYISDHAHKYDDINIPISHQSVCGVSEVRIGAHTWLGQNSVVLPGVKIGRHCVIGANSVVNSDIPDYTVAVGAPAKIVKSYNRKIQRWVRV